jgi:hypothetical protein
MEPTAKKNKLSLSGTTICLSGTMSVTRKVFEAFMTSNGASLSGSCGKSTTYLCCTEAELSAQVSKVVAAAKNGIPAVSEGFIRSLVEGGAADHSADPVFLASKAAGGGAAAGSGFTATPQGTAGSRAAARAVMLAKSWGETDPTGWWISEKLDGVRAYWDGKGFYSRQVGDNRVLSVELGAFEPFSSFVFCRSLSLSFAAGKPLSCSRVVQGGPP